MIVPVVPVGAGVNWNTRPRTASKPFGTFAIQTCSTEDESLAAMFASKTSVGTVGKCSSLAPGPAIAHTHESLARDANTRAYATSGAVAVVVAVQPSTWVPVSSVGADVKSGSRVAAASIVRSTVGPQINRSRSVLGACWTA